MKNRSVFSIFIFILVILGLFAACIDPTQPDLKYAVYTVKFEANGGSPAPSPQNIVHGAQVVMPPTMTKTGYNFGGWYKDADCTNQWDFAADAVTGAITLYAKWNDIPLSTCTVTFNANGGSPAPNSQDITHGGKVVQPPAMTKSGFGFGGWYKEADCTNQWDFAVDTVTGNITLYAKWDNNYYTVDFEANGGSPAPYPQNIAYGGAVVQPSAMTKSGYGFGGWYQEAACTNLWNFATDTVSGAITLYAQWNANNNTDTCTVNFQANGGSPAPDPQNIAYGGKVVQPPAMTNPSYGFGGWYREAACINQWDFTANTVTGTITLYAKWDSTELSTCTITFNANGGTPAPDPQDITHGGTVVQPPAMTKTGYGFGGWYKEAGCTNQWNFAADTVTGTITLYAKWDNNYYTVDFEANGGSPAPYPQNITHGGKVVQPPAMTKTGYGFGGWYKEAGCTNQWNFDTDSVTGAVTLYAKWNSDVYNNTYTVDFQANGGSPAPNPQNIVDGGKVVQPPAMTKSGYGFDGWYKEAACTNQWDFATDTVTNNIILYARWEPLVTVPGTTLADKLQWLKTNAASNSTYMLEVTAAHESLAPQNLSYTGRDNITIRLKGVGTGRVIELSGKGSLFSVEDGVTLILEENLILKGNSSNNASLIRVNLGSTLTMNQGVKISGNTHSFGSGVFVAGGTFTMSGGEISGNTSSSHGGGVYVTVGDDGRYVEGTFTMNGGAISGNTVIATVSSSDASYGGGVCVERFCTFIMNSGEISGNTSSSSGAQFSFGGGVYVEGTFIMNDGKISGNTVTVPNRSLIRSHGGGVYVNGGTFTMSGGTISGNTATSSTSTSTPASDAPQSYGGGVYMNSGTFTMSGGAISGNTASSSSGSSSSSTSYSFGGGVYVDKRGTFTKSGGGTITGYTSDTVNGNVVKKNNTVQSNQGHAVYANNSNTVNNDYSSYKKRKEMTAGPEDNLSYIGRYVPPVWDGAWDY